MILIGLFVLLSPSFRNSVCSLPPPYDSLNSSQKLITQQHESNGRKPQLGAIRGSSMRAYSLLESLFQNQTESDRFGAAVDSLARDYSCIRNPLLEELLIPRSPVSGQPQNPSYGILRDEFQRYLHQFNPFERMSLIAKRFATYNMGYKSLKSYQLDIIGSARWLSSVLK